MCRGCQRLLTGLPPLLLSLLSIKTRPRGGDIIVSWSPHNSHQSRQYPTDLSTGQSYYGDIFSIVVPSSLRSWHKTSLHGGQLRKTFINLGPPNKINEHACVGTHVHAHLPTFAYVHRNTDKNVRDKNDDDLNNKLDFFGISSDHEIWKKTFLKN